MIATERFDHGERSVALGGPRRSTKSPLRFTISALPEKHSFASRPPPFRMSFDSGSVFGSCVSLLRFSPRKLPHPVPS